MIAAATQGRLLFGWFDLALVGMLVLGFWRGRKNGMTKEIIPAFRWLLIVIVAGFGYQLLGNMLIHSGFIRHIAIRNVDQNTEAYLVSYLGLAGAVALVFVYLNKFFARKLEGSSLFGSSEYYLGMISGVVRYSSMAIFGLALLHAPHYTQAEVAAQQAYDQRWYGGDLKGFSGDYIPSMNEVQMAVFHNSLLGPFIDKGLNALLINSQPKMATARPATMSFEQ